MKPGFALSLSFEGITFLYRSAAGWRRLGKVRLDVSDLEAELAALRDKAAALSPPNLFCKLILPNDQIRYMTVETGPVDRSSRLRLARQALDGATPYRVDELAFDIIEDGARTHVAAVARETLAEAETFAVQHGFDPVSFVSIPDPAAFNGEPFFGETAHATDRLGLGGQITPESEAMIEAAPGAEAAAIDLASAGPTGAVGFSSRRGKVPGAADGAAQPDGAVAMPQVGRSEPIKPLPPRPARPAPTVATAQSRITMSEPQRERRPTPPQAPMEPPAQRYERPERTAPKSAAPQSVADAQPSNPRKANRKWLVAVALTVLLLIVLAAVAALASRNSDTPIARIFDRSPADQTDRAAAPVAMAIDQDILDMPAQTVTAPLVEPDESTVTSNNVASLDPEFGPSPVVASANPTTLDAPVAALGPVPAFNTAPDAEVTLAARSNAFLTLSQSEWAGQGAGALPSIGAPAELPEPAALTPDASRQNNVAAYAVSGIWSEAPPTPDTPGLITLDDLYVAAIDHATLTPDAIALPLTVSYRTDISPAGVASPAAAGNVFKMDALGLVDPSPEGTLTPDGVIVYLGNPPKVPPPTPRRIQSRPDPEPLQPRLPKKRPRERPADLAENVERELFGGMTREELSKIRPRGRPFAPKSTEELVAELQAQTLSPAQQRLATLKPKARPRDFSQSVERAVRSAAATPNAAPQAGPAAAASTASTVTAAVEPTERSKAAPAVPRSQIGRASGTTPATVAKQATVKNAINLHRVNLIGVYGSPSNRRALVRLSNGRYKKVKVGDSIEGGRVIAIGDSELRYQNGGRNVILRMPRG